MKVNFVLVGALFIVIQTAKCAEAHNYEVLQPNVLVVEVDLAERNPVVEVPLRCRESHVHEETIWRNNDMQLPQRGNDITVTVEEMFGGNYTCHDSTGSFLNYTLVLVRSPSRKILMGSQDADYIKCSTQNYNGSFKCSWNWSPGRKGDIVFVKADRSSEGSNITCSLSKNELSISCSDGSYCPYAEEVDHVILNVGIRHFYRLEEYSVTFFISEIVRPDRIQFRRIDTNKIQLEYPDTWSVPHSYFPLTFQVKEVPHKKDCSCESRCRRQRPEKIHTTQQHQWSIKKGYVICARAKDALCNSTWSEWSQYIDFP